MDEFRLGKMTMSDEPCGDPMCDNSCTCSDAYEFDDPECNKCPFYFGHTYEEWKLCKVSTCSDCLEASKNIKVERFTWDEAVGDFRKVE